MLVGSIKTLGTFINQLGKNNIEIGFNGLPVGDPWKDSSYLGKKFTYVGRKEYDGGLYYKVQEVA